MFRRYALCEAAHALVMLCDAYIYLQVKAVEHVQLSHYVDVIVVSTASHMYNGTPLNRHLASLTGGGKSTFSAVPNLSHATMT